MGLDALGVMRSVLRRKARLAPDFGAGLLANPKKLTKELILLVGNKIGSAHGNRTRLSMPAALRQ
jgi:hypothetical protein